MNISAGLVGLPNVGKSTLFNALTKSSVPAENYPFCTIDPHIACTPVPDNRLLKLKEIYKSEKIIPATIQFVDIAGLVKGAASGEGLGNQFLSNIREVSLILHVLRCFEDPNIIRMEEVDPLVDFEIIITELMLKDLESVIKRKEKIEHLLKSSKNDPKKYKELTQEISLINQLSDALNSSNIKKVQDIINNNTITTISLLSAKKFIIIANISEDDIQNDAYKNKQYYKELVKKFGQDLIVPVCAKIEFELSGMEEEDQNQIRTMLAINNSGIDSIISNTFQNLDLISFFTCGPKEIRAWPIKKGLNIKQAAGEIHTDLEKGFICAEVFNYNDLITYGTTLKLKEAGKIRTEGKDYIVQDGDIVLVKFNI